MKEPQDVALGLLKKQEMDLARRLSSVRKAIALLEPTPSGTPELSQRPRSKLQILELILRHHPEGVRVRDIPDLMKAMGHTGTSSSTTWLCPSQMRPGDRFFIRETGWIKPTPEFLVDTGGLSDAFLDLQDNASVGTKESDPGAGEPTSPAE